MTPTDDQIEEIIRRSAEGEGVVRMIQTMDLDVNETLDILKGKHEQLKAAKKKFNESVR